MQLVAENMVGIMQMIAHRLDALGGNGPRLLMVHVDGGML